MNLHDSESLTTIIHNIVIVLATVIGLPLFFYQRWMDRKQRDEQVYITMQDAYDKWLAFAVQHVDLNLYDDTSERLADLKPNDRRRKLIVFSLLINLFEKAHVLYADCTNEAKKRNWKMWAAYISGWCERQSFQDAFVEILKNDETEFMKYLKKTFHDAQRRSEDGEKARA